MAEILRNRVRRPAVSLTGAGLILAILVWLFVPGTYLSQIDSTLLVAIAAVGLNLITGNSNQPSIATAAFLACGGYTVALTHSYMPFPADVVLGGIVAGAIGFLIGLPSLRLRGIYLILSTLALHFIVAYIIIQYDVSSGAVAGHLIPPPRLFGWVIDSGRSWFVLAACALIITCAFALGILKGRPGRAMSAVRTHEAEASVMGISPTQTKLGVFIVSSGIIGIAGGLLGYFLGVVSSDYYSLSLAISYLAIVLIGGLGSVLGAVVGAFVVNMLPFIIQNVSLPLLGGSGTYIQANLGVFNILIYAVIVLAVIYTNPKGIVGAISALLSRLQHRRRPRAAVASDLQVMSNKSLL